MPSTLTEPLPVESVMPRTVSDPGCQADPGRDPEAVSGFDASPPFAPWRLPLAQLLDSAAPTGTFSHSFGMETAIVTGEVCDAGTAAKWLRCYLATSLEFNDALAIRLGGVGVGPLDDDQGDAAQITDTGPFDPEGAADRLCELSALLEASTMAPEARRANTAIGRRMMQISGDFGVPLVAAFASQAKRNGVHPHPALVAAAVGCGLGAAWPEVCGLYLYSCLTSLVQNAVRAIPLGQIAGQQILAGLAAPVAATVRRTARADPGDLGSSSPMLDVLQCEHETQLGRMFIS